MTSHGSRARLETAAFSGRTRRLWFSPPDLQLALLDSPVVVSDAA